MREIKFRAWDFTQKIMLDCDYIGGYTLNYLEENFGEIILMQFTGLKDKNGVEIYEGDIIQENFGKVEEIMSQPGHKLEVVWASSAFKAMDMRSMLDNPRDFYLHSESLLSDTLGNYLVIGNIHEHPELLK